MPKTKEDIKKILRKLHLYDLTYKIWCGVKSVYIKLGLNKNELKRQFFESFDSFEKRIEKLQLPSSRRRIIFYGYNISLRKILLYDISQKLMNQNPDYEVLIISNIGSESKGLVPEGIAKRLSTNVLFFPGAATSENLSQSLKLDLTTEMKELIAKKPYLQEAIQNAKSTFKNAKDNYVEVMMCYCYYSYLSIIEKLNASLIVIWNEFKYIHYLFAEMCREAGVKVIFAEFGSLPGTIIFDTDGQMGESFPATHFEEFNNLPVNNIDLDKSRMIINSLKESGLNRNRQPEHSNNSELKRKLKPGRPIVLFAGQCDRDSGMIPYTEKTHKFHSPIFKSSHEAMLFLAELAKKNDWNFIYKPPPLVKNEIKITDLPSNVIFISDININDIIDISDVVVTILSSVAYISLIRDTATVMLGYNQIRGKNCAYEAYSKEIIEDTIKEALRHGYTQDQKESFIRHVAQMVKYYLYDDGQQKDMEIGQSIEHGIKFFDDIMKNAKDTSLESRERDKKYRNILFLCGSLSELISAIQVKEGVLKGYRTTLLMTNVNLNSYATILKNCFDNVSTLRETMDEELFNKDYTDIYLTSFNNVNLRVYNKLCKKNIPSIHIYDICNGTLCSYKNVHDMIYGTKDNDQYESNDQIKEAIVELLLYDLKKFDRNPFRGIKTTITPLGQYIWPEAKGIISAMINDSNANHGIELLKELIDSSGCMEDIIHASQLLDKIEMINRNEAV